MSNPYSKANANLPSRVDSNNGRSSPIFGRVYWAPNRSVWVSVIYAGALLGGYASFTWEALLLCLATTFITLWAGYSVGLHRHLIHRSFQCSWRLENCLVYLGVLTGVGGPFAIIGRHDMRDWAQRQPRCHDYFASRQNIVTDWLWTLHCEFQLDYPPIFRYEPRLLQSRFYQWLEQTWMLQQLPWAIAFYHVGGWSWVFWGIYVRLAVSITAVWLVTYLSHHLGQQPRYAKGDRIQRRNLPFLGLLTLGEGWQNNHQAFPHSAKFSMEPKQYDPSWWLIKAFSAIGLAWNIKRPHPRFLHPLNRPLPSTPVAIPPEGPTSDSLQKITSRQKVTTL